MAKGVVPLGQLLKCDSLHCQVELYDSSMNKLESLKLFLNIEYKQPFENSKQVDTVEQLNDSGILNDSSTGSASHYSNEKADDFKFNTRQRDNRQRLKKIQDFQIRVKIIEARQLDGNNVSSLCRVKCSTNVKTTKTVRSSNNPYWNEVFFFNYHCSQAELFDEMIEFQVLRPSKLRQDMLIGCFKTDIGFIYDEANHSLTRKWLLLSDTGDQVTSAKGYLKISVNILGPGDEIPVSCSVEIIILFGD